MRGCGGRRGTWRSADHLKPGWNLLRHCLISGSEADFVESAAELNAAEFFQRVRKITASEVCLLDARATRK